MAFRPRGSQLDRGLHAIIVRFCAVIICNRRRNSLAFTPRARPLRRRDLVYPKSRHDTHLLRPDGQYVPDAVRKMKAAAAGKIEGRHNDAAARGYDGGFSCRQISGVENNERRILWRGIVRVGLVETAAFNAGS